MLSDQSEQIIEVQRTANNAFLVTVSGLCENGYLTEAQYTEIITNYAVMVRHRAWIPGFIRKLIRWEYGDNISTFHLVRLYNNPREEE